MVTVKGLIVLPMADADLFKLATSVAEDEPTEALHAIAASELLD